MPGVWEEHIRGRLEAQAKADLTRRLLSVTQVRGPEIEVEGRTVLLFSSNDYLGYSQHPALKQAAREAAEVWGTGAGASRLISGNLALYQDLETEAARFKHAEAALVFATGFMANLGLIASLVGPGDLVLSDALNHASLIDACRLSRAEIRIMPHADPEAYAVELKKVEPGRRVLLLTDAVFSMDGDLAPLAELAESARKYEALLAVDDAHGTGVLGPTGRGSLEHLGVDPAGIVQVGTFSKALGSLGGFVAGPALVIELLRNRARTLFYSTALPPSVLAVNRRALALIDEEPQVRARLQKNVRLLRAGLSEAGLDLLPGPAAIVPVMIGEPGPAAALARELLQDGLFCPAIRPPTVPPGQSRLRLSVMAVHTTEQIRRAVDLIPAAALRLGILK